MTKTILEIDNQGWEKMRIIKDKNKNSDYCYEVEFKINGDKEWNSFGGGVGYTTATFKTLEKALKFITKGQKEQAENPEIWLEMVELKYNNKKGYWENNINL